MSKNSDTSLSSSHHLGILSLGSLLHPIAMNTRKERRCNFSPFVPPVRGSTRTYLFKISEKLECKMSEKFKEHLFFAYYLFEYLPCPVACRCTFTDLKELLNFSASLNMLLIVPFLL